MKSVRKYEDLYGHRVCINLHTYRHVHIFKTVGDFGVPWDTEQYFSSYHMKKDGETLIQDINSPQ
jgi:hypothetical protein